MCIIVVKPAKAIITRKTLKTCYDSNSDGAGMMFATGGKLFVDKGYFSFRRFYKQFREHERAYPDSNFVLHFRIATSGGIRPDTCHPFYVHKNLAFAHNGILSRLGTKDKSDTMVFNETILQLLPPNFLDMDKAKNAIEDYITTSLSKVVFMDNAGKLTIMNEKNGHWDNECWFSNYGYYNYTRSGRYDYILNGQDWYDTHINYADISAHTFKKCIVCSCQSHRDTVIWKSNIKVYSEIKSGWVCNFCLDYYVNSKYNCAGCGESFNRTMLTRNIYGEYICDDCLLINGQHIDTNNATDFKCCICKSEDIYYRDEDNWCYCKKCGNESGLFGDLLKYECNTTEEEEQTSVTGICIVCSADVTSYYTDNWRCPNCGTYLDINSYESI